MNKVAVILFNLGGPDQPSSVQPFLFNLFNDRAIINLPQPIRWLIAKRISSKRAPIAREIYQHLGGSSPLLKMTEDQGQALEARLSEQMQARVFIAMRYWHPMSEETVKQVIAYNPDQIVLLPLYPQFSTTTSGSSLKEWQHAASAAGLAAPTSAICCYPSEPGLVSAHRQLIENALGKIESHLPVRILFSAHGLPQKIIDRGDPYQQQVEITAKAIFDQIKHSNPERNIDHVICYQSRVGPLKWIGPSLDEELERAARDEVAIVIDPLAFVSEHSETLVELDIEYREMAEQLGIKHYHRVETVAVADSFIDGLANLVEQSLTVKTPVLCGENSGNRICSLNNGLCPNTG